MKLESMVSTEEDFFSLGPSGSPLLVSHHPGLHQDCDTPEVLKKQQKQGYGFVPPSVPEIQTYVFIKMYSPVTMITYTRMNGKRKDKE